MINYLENMHITKQERLSEVSFILFIVLDLLAYNYEQMVPCAILRSYVVGKLDEAPTTSFDLFIP